MTVNYPIFLSTTSPNDNIPVIVVRQFDEGTQVIDVTVTKDGQPMDLTGYTPFFCVKQGHHIGLGISEQIVNTVTDAKNGKFSYTFTKYDLQHVGENTAYFSFRTQQEDQTWKKQFSTRDFPFTVKKSIYGEGIKDSNYIWTFEEILRYFHEWVEQSKNIYDDWYIKSQEELQRIIAEFQGWIGESQASYDKWITENKSDFINWMESNKEGFGEWFDYVKSILDENAASNLLNQLDEIRPSQELIELQHTFNGYPKARVLYWEYGLATRNLEDEPTGLGGSASFTVEHEIEYLDRDKLKIRVPMKYKLVEPEVIFIDSKTVRLISDYRIIQVEFLESNISIYQDVTETIVLDFKSKKEGSSVENASYACRGNYASLQAPTKMTIGYTQAQYDLISTKDDQLIKTGGGVANYSNLTLFAYNIIEEIKRKLPNALISNTLEEQITELKSKVLDWRTSFYGYGSGASGNKLSLALWREDSWGTSSVTNDTNEIKEVTWISNFPRYLQDDGYIYVLNYPPASDGTIASMSYLDYAKTEITIKYRKEAK